MKMVLFPERRKGWKVFLGPGRRLPPVWLELLF